MNATELTTFTSFVRDIKVSPFDNSSDCVAVLTSDSIILGQITNDKDCRWKLLKEFKLQCTSSAIAFNPISRTFVTPMIIKLSYADKNGVYNITLGHNCDDVKQTLLKGNMEVSAMNYSDDGSRIAFTGGDKYCHILSCQSDVLSECDSIVSEAVAEFHCSVPLTSEGRCVLWHKTRANYLVVAEIVGIVRLLACVTDGDDEKFVCEYVINVGLRLPTPLLDLDLVHCSERTSHDFIVAGASGLHLFALDRPLTTLERLPHASSATGNLLVRVSRRWGHGSVLATVYGNGQLAVTDLCGGRVLLCPVTSCAALAWHASRPLLLAASPTALVAVRFQEARAQ